MEHLEVLEQIPVGRRPQPQVGQVLALETVLQNILEDVHDLARGSGRRRRGRGRAGACVQRWRLLRGLRIGEAANDRAHAVEQALA